MRRASYLIPALLIVLLAWVGQPSWWAVAMLTGGAKFAWDYLWGERAVLDGGYGLKLAAVGAALVAAGWLLAFGLDMNLREFDATAGRVSRSIRFLYHVPAVGIGLALYGLLIWSAARSRDAR